MHTQHRVFSRELIQKVNQKMITQKSVDLSGLPIVVAVVIRDTKFSREDIKSAFAKARCHLVGM